MNVQRWLTLGIIAVLVGLFTARNLLQPDSEDDTSTPSFPTAIPTAPGDAPASSVITGEVQATLAVLDTLQLPADTAAEITSEMMDAEGDILLEGPFTLKIGNFLEFDPLHGGSGVATIFEAPDGNRFLLLNPFSVTDGPNLRVLLASHPAPRTSSELASGQVTDLGELQSSEGEQHFPIPLTVNLEQVESVVIYSKPFDIIFSTAPLQ